MRNQQGKLNPNFRHGMSRTPIYAKWNSMLERCYNKNCKAFQFYGDRGISVCKEWEKDFMSFYDYVSKLPGYGTIGMTLDRIDNDGNYEPDNIRWVDMRIQQINTRKQKKTSSKYKGVSWQKAKKKWKAEIKVNSKSYFLGRFDSEEKAVEVRNNFILENNIKEYPIQEIIQ